MADNKQDTSNDEALAMALQMEMDRQVTQERRDQRVAEAMDPWAQAEHEWANVEANQDITVESKKKAMVGVKKS